MESSIINVFRTAVFKAAKGLIRDFRELESLQVSLKDCGTFVTSADIRSNEVIIETLKKYHPKYSILSEESGEDKGSDYNHRFVIDPLDGTNNFMHALPYFCIAVSLEERTKGGIWEQIAGVVYAPILDELFFAQKGRGAFVVINNQERKLFVSRKKVLQNAIVASNISNEKDFAFLKKNFQNIRANGSAALDLAYLAAGKFDSFFYRNLKPWDISAGSLLVKEAKGFIGDLKGGDKFFETGEVIASNLEISDIYKKTVAQNYN